MKRHLYFFFTLNLSLKDCAKILGQELGDVIFEQRKSLNNINNQYFHAQSEKLEFNLVHNTDHQTIENYRYCLQIDWFSNDSEVAFVIGIKKILAQAFSQYDLEIAQVLDFGKKSQSLIPFDGRGQLDKTSQVENQDALTPLPPVRFDVLEVVDIRDIGSFLDWGQAKDLFLPESEETKELRLGQKVVVAIFTDRQGRPLASMRLDRHLSQGKPDYKENQEVSLLLVAETDLGYKAVVDQKYWGVLYRDEVFQRFHYGQKLQGYIKKIREDGKIDLRIDRPGHKAAQGAIGPQILEELKKAGGFLNITDRTSPERIYQLFGTSKKKYKIALGDLYKRRLITISDDGVRLVKK